MKKLSKLERAKRTTPFLIGATIFIALYSLTLILPLIWAVFSSLKVSIDFQNTVFAWPKYGFHLENWYNAFFEIELNVMTAKGPRDVYLLEMFGYSIIYSVGTAFIACFSRSACAYVVAKYRHLGWTKLVHTLVIILMIISFPSNLAITIKFYKLIGLYNNFIGCIIMSFGFNGSHFLYFYAAYCGVSSEYAEAAEIDGANQLTIMLRIMMPMVKNIFMGLFILNFIAVWNDYSPSLVFLPSYPMVAYGLYAYQFKTQGANSVPLKLAGCTLVILPTLALFVIFKDKIVSNLSIGGLKG